MALAPDGTRRVRGACALDCPDTCSWAVTVEDGRAMKLEGDPAHPFTRGALCNKVNGYVAYSQSPDRLLHPMRRVGPKGCLAFEPISWEEALDEIAERFAATIREFGPEAIWPYLGSGSMGLIQGVYGAGRRLWNALGASQHLMTICTIAGGSAPGTRSETTVWGWTRRRSASRASSSCGAATRSARTITSGAPSPRPGGRARLWS